LREQWKATEENRHLLPTFPRSVASRLNVAPPI